MARRRQKISAPTSEYVDPDGNTLVLRGSMTVGSRQRYTETLKGIGESAAASQEDNWFRASELLFERLAVQWVINGLPIKKQNELVGRFRMASKVEREWVRGVLQKHCAEFFPDLKVP